MHAPRMLSRAGWEAHLLRGAEHRAEVGVMVKTEQDWVRGSLGDPSILTYSQALQPCWVHFLQTTPGGFHRHVQPSCRGPGQHICSRRGPAFQAPPSLRTSGRSASPAWGGLRGRVCRLSGVRLWKAHRQRLPEDRKPRAAWAGASMVMVTKSEICYQRKFCRSK